MQQMCSIPSRLPLREHPLLWKQTELGSGHGDERVQIRGAGLQGRHFPPAASKHPIYLWFYNGQAEPLATVAGWLWIEWKDAGSPLWKFKINQYRTEAR